MRNQGSRSALGMNCFSSTVLRIVLVNEYPGGYCTMAKVVPSNRILIHVYIPYLFVRKEKKYQRG